jgi:hypothetical protein
MSRDLSAWIFCSSAKAFEPVSDFLLEKAVETLPMNDLNFPDLLT